jgi:uncharacterized membrane protein
MHCINCGKELPDGAKFCNDCGSPVVAQQTTNQAPAQEQPAAAQTAPAEQEAQDNKIIFILSYILFFLPLIACPNSKAGRFHANQGLVLLLASIAGQIVVAIVSGILSFIFAAMWLFTIASGIGMLLYTVWYIVVLVFVIMGMINASKGELKPLPIIGKFTIIK